MWPAQQWTLCGLASTKAPQQEELQVAMARDHAFRVQSSSHNPSVPVTQPVPGESQLSTSVSINYSPLMNKAESIIETHRDPNWESIFGQLTNSKSVPNISSNNRFQCVQNFHSPTDL